MEVSIENTSQKQEMWTLAKLKTKEDNFLQNQHCFR